MKKVDIAVHYIKFDHDAEDSESILRTLEMDKLEQANNSEIDHSMSFIKCHYLCRVVRIRSIRRQNVVALRSKYE